MYIFVFNWTPAIKDSVSSFISPPFGMIFATFMVACMGGSSLFAIVCLSHAPRHPSPAHLLFARIRPPTRDPSIPRQAIGNIKPEMLLRYVFFGGAFALSLPQISSTTLSLMVSFMLFETVVGIYWPSIGTVKSQARNAYRTQT